MNEFINGDYFVFVMAILLAAAGSIAYRWRGSNENTVPVIVKNRTIRRLLCTVLIALGLFVATGSVWAFLAIPLAYPALIMGHGSYFHRSNPNNLNTDNEQFAFLTKLISDPLNGKARYVGMCLTGLASTIPVALIPVIAYYSNGALVSIAPWYALIGIMKGVTYHTISPNTERAEFIWGAILTGSAALVAFGSDFWRLVF